MNTVRDANGRFHVVYFDRNNLIQIDEDAYAVEEGSVTVE